MFQVNIKYAISYKYLESLLNDYKDVFLNFESKEEKLQELLKQNLDM